MGERCEELDSKEIILNIRTLFRRGSTFGFFSGFVQFTGLQGGLKVDHNLADLKIKNVLMGDTVYI